ncbi:hypothetical protein LWI29_027761 [Acer saccharum]|uniref:Eukaryotic translation initiation factor 3 subunit C N-terminal domain-containing protein n=1 Tax=Acer saccharum TaxID=4024 RepID=A0AA39W5H8_ACESA|nr:hypothetical protein LWI29_027761 [Acer saccharum]
MRVTESDKVPYVHQSACDVGGLLNQAMANKEAKKKMSSSNAKALNSMKQKLKKNKQYEDLINKGEEDEFDVEEDPNNIDIGGSDKDGDVDDDGDDERKADDENDEGWKTTGRKSKSLMEKQFKNPSEITWDTVNKKFKEVIAARGRKGTGRFEQVEQLTF